MKTTLGLVWVLIVFAGAISGLRVMADDGSASELGYHEETTILPEDEEICPGTTLLQNDDGTFENGYAWQYGSVVPPDYGAFAECYDADYVCGIQFMLTTIMFDGGTMDVFVWDYDMDGNPPPGPDPGNVLCVLTDIDPFVPAFWPTVSAHNVRVCCNTNGLHFVGFWGVWPEGYARWYVAADENGPPSACSRTKVRIGSVMAPAGFLLLKFFPVARR